jgi:uridine kinase
MRTAILISGYLRTFKSNITNIQDKIINKFSEVDIYIHITKNEKDNDKYLNINNIDDDLKYINDLLKPKSLIFEDNLILSNNIKENDVLNLWLKYYKLNDIKNINETKFGKYDLVIKYRPDLSIISDDLFEHYIDGVFIPIDSKIDNDKLRNSNDSYICDIFAYGDSESMNKYFSIYNQLRELIENHGTVSETLLYHYLNYNNIKYKLIDIKYNVILSSCNVFAICGDSGSGKTTIGNILKQYFSNSFMLECDRYHKWERGHDNWQDFTHLNPDANYITKMNDDIFNLKVGKSILQVDYDHKSGKFTEPEKIDSSDNIIVCGLHSLYSTNESVYNLKIFIDTDELLKTKWKIQRDVKKRGYTPDQVVKQIESRKEDYFKYVYPQRNISDVIINFYTLDDIDIFSNTDNNISLRIFISTIFDITDILDNIRKLNIEFEYSLNDNFYEINFLKYQNIPIIKKTFNNYYDIIIYFILNIKK